MDLCIKTDEIYSHWAEYRSFNPCFNGSMYKNGLTIADIYLCKSVSILVLMDLCIKTIFTIPETDKRYSVSILVLMDLCIKT